MLSEEQYKKGLEGLLNRCVNLHTSYVLEQYGLSEEQSLEIVANLTGLSKERLTELRANRDKNLMDGFTSPDVMAAMLIQGGAIDPNVAYRVAEEHSNRASK